MCVVVVVVGRVVVEGVRGCLEARSNAFFGFARSN
jgi:hypothetical protein